MNIAIVDDSLNDRMQLIRDLKQYAVDCTTAIRVVQYENGEQFLKQDNLSTTDLVFLDIYMDNLSGMDVANEIRRQNAACQLVFISSSSAFAVESYKVNALYYIIKPYVYQELVTVLDLALKSTKKPLYFITVKSGREWRKILLSDILYIDYSNHYVQIHLEEAIVSSYMKFSEIEEMLTGYTEFLSCYRCVIVNMKKIKKVVDLFFLLGNGEYVPINRKQVKEIKNRYSDFIFGLIEEGDKI